MKSGLSWFFTRRRPESKPGASERMERKFYLPDTKIAFAAQMLAHCCPADRNYPRGEIHSLYFDTADLDHYEDSEQGDRLRKKVRIRWYDRVPENARTAAVFLELKSKTGFAGVKQRKSFEVSPQRLNESALRDGVLPYPAIAQTLAEFGYYPQDLLLPTILISYQRLRFTDLTTGARVSLDWNIRSTLISPMLNCREGMVRMEGGVIEIKGRSMDLPAALEPLYFLETDWSRYSKYACCLQSQLEETGSVGRVLPSGRGEYL
jgi:hypothetical protein